MKIARVIGNVISTIKQPIFRGTKLLLVQPLDLNYQPEDRVVVAVDTVDAGPSALVILVDEGRAARDILLQEKCPVRALVIGVIDEVQLVREESG